MTEALQALDNLAGDVLEFSAESGVGWTMMIGDEERFQVVVAKIGDEREGERAPRRGLGERVV